MNVSHRFAFKCQQTEGTIVAFCLNEPGIMTQVESFAELPGMLKDAVATYYSGEDLREFINMPITDDIGKLVDEADHEAFVDEAQDQTFYQVVTVTLEVPADWFRTLLFHGMVEANITQFKCLNAEIPTVTTRTGDSFQVINRAQAIWRDMSVEQRRAVVSMEHRQIPADLQATIKDGDAVLTHDFMI